jgi:hypothetical protein
MTIFNHLEFLLPEHSCVIVPDLGGFILNMEPAVFLSDGRIDTPRYSIVFNTGLNYDDGILASSIAGNENISYNAACRKIESFVATVKSELKAGETVACARLGSFTLDDNNNVIFSQNKNALFPGIFGLSATNVLRLADIERTNLKIRKKISLKYAVGGVAAAIAAIALFMAPVNIDERKVQKADFLTTITKSLPINTAPAKSAAPAKDAAPVKNVANTAPLKESKSAALPSAAVQPAAEHSYYIIIGGENTKSGADVLLKKFKNKGFRNADIVAAQDRYRIYISAFDDRNKAEAFLDTFRKENPELATAWMYSKRNN